MSDFVLWWVRVSGMSVGGWKVWPGGGSQILNPYYKVKTFKNNSSPELGARIFRCENTFVNGKIFQKNNSC